MNSQGAGISLGEISWNNIIRRGLTDHVEQREFVRMMELACGAGGMVVSGAHALYDVQVNYQQAMYLVSIDIDLRCDHTTYVQLALPRVPAVVGRL